MGMPDNERSVEKKSVEKKSVEKKSVEKEPVYIYLHGFASSPRSRKAVDLQTRFAQCDIPLLIPDLNQDDFSHLTLTRQLQQVEQLISEYAATDSPITLIGSSLGGLTAAWLGQRQPQVQRLVLLAPAFGFLAHWLTRLGEVQLQEWQTSSYLSMYHYGAGQIMPLHYQFLEDAARYQETEIQRPIPTLVLHGQHDEVIPVQASVDFGRDRPWVKLIQLDSDHALTDVSDAIWAAIGDFCQLMPTRT